MGMARQESRGQFLFASNLTLEASLEPRVGQPPQAWDERLQDKGKVVGGRRDEEGR